MIRILPFLFLFGFYNIVTCQISKDDFYSSLFGKDSLVDYVLRNREKFRLQFIVTNVQRDDNGNEMFNTYDFSTNEYFYPASLVKLPVAIATLEMLDSLNITLDSKIKMKKDVLCGSNAFVDITQKNTIPIEVGIEEMLAISNNEYYSLFFHLVTPKRLNSFLLKHGVMDSKIYNSFSGCPKGKEIETNSYTIINRSGNSVYSQPKTRLDSSEYMNRLPYSNSKLIGKYCIQNGKKIKNSYDFNYHLDYPLADIHSTLFRLVFPQSFSTKERFNINSNSRLFLLKCLSKYPREMQNKAYHNLSVYPDNYYKYSIIGDKPRLSKNDNNCRTYSKIGIAYGFVTETAYIVDFEKQQDFLMSVSIYVNTDEIMNDGKYEYESIARPFLAKFSRIIQKHLIIPSEKSSPQTFQYFQQLKDLKQAE